MGNYFEKFEAAETKMINLMEANGLLHTFNTKTFPITMTIQPNNTPDAQMAMFEEATDGVSSQDAKLVLQFLVGEIVVRVYGRLIISDALMGKIKNQSKKMRDLWLQADFAARMEQAGYVSPSGMKEPENGGSGPEEADFKEFFEDEAEDEGQE